MRQLTPRDHLINHAVQELVARNGGPLKATAVTRVNDRTLSNYGLPHTPESMPVYVVADLEQACGASVVSSLLAGMVVKTVAVAKPKDPHLFIAEMTAEAGDIARVTIEGADDGHWSLNEYDRQISEVDDLIELLTNEREAIAGARAQLASNLNGPRPHAVGAE